MKTVRIAGLGSAGGGDDAVGLIVAETLTARGVEAARVRDAAALVELALDVDQLVIIDAVVGLGPPGTVAVLTEDDLAGDLQPVSTHALSVPAALAFARLLYPDRVAALIQLVGVAIAPPSGLQLDLSAPVLAAVPEAVERVMALLDTEDA